MTRSVESHALVAVIVPLVLGMSGLFSSFPSAPIGGPGGGGSTGGCPSINGIGNKQVSPIVGASFSLDGSGTVATYVFNSFQNENPSGGVPGLIKFCVYPAPAPNPDSATSAALGANGQPWVVSFGSKQGFFAFGRHRGNPNNIPLDGTSTVMGSATWGSGAPTEQMILLHINDAAECQRLYGTAGDETGQDTCFVFPGGEETVPVQPRGALGGGTVVPVVPTPGVPAQRPRSEGHPAGSDCGGSHDSTAPGIRMRRI